MGFSLTETGGLLDRSPVSSYNTDTENLPFQTGKEPQMSDDEHRTTNQVQCSLAQYIVEIVTEVRLQGEDEPLSMVTHVLSGRTMKEVKELLNKVHLWMIDK